MRLRLLLAAATALPMALAAVAATPAGGDECRVLQDDVEGCQVVTHLTCDTAEGGKVHNGLLHSMPEFRPEVELGSFQSGAACGSQGTPVASGTIQDTPYDFNTFGYIEGSIDSVTVDLYSTGVGAERAAGEVILPVRLTLDGDSPSGGEDNTAVDGSVSSSPRTFEVAVVPEGATDGIVHYRFTLTNLGDVIPDLLEPGLDDTERYVVLTVGEPSNSLGQWVWGASEVPAGLTFNPVEDAELGTVVDANDIYRE